VSHWHPARCIFFLNRKQSRKTYFVNDQSQRAQFQPCPHYMQNDFPHSTPQPSTDIETKRNEPDPVGYLVCPQRSYIQSCKLRLIFPPKEASIRSSMTCCKTPSSHGLKHHATKVITLDF
jgi:hypothetical protein